MMNGKVLIAGTLVLALAACNKSGQQNAANGGTGGAGGGSAAPVAASGAATVQPGLWEVSYEANVTGANLPPAYAAAMKGHKDTKRDCITPEQAAQPVNMMKDKNAACDYSGFSFGNGRIQGTIVCGGKGAAGKTSMTMNGQYDAQNYAYTTTMTNQQQGMSMTIETKAIGHRVGECPAGGAENGK
jgi:hypothetical protein